MKTRPFLRNLLIAILMIGVYSFYGQVQPAGAFPDTIIDEFTDTTSLSRVGVGTNSGTFDDAGILGGERDVFLNVTAGGGTLTVDTNTSLPGEYSHSAGAGVVGTSELTYDGDDSNAGALDPTGLGGADMTTNGNNAFILLITSDDFSGQITITAYTDATSCSNATLTLPGGISNTTLPRSFLYFFADFTTACANPADFTNIGALQILVDPLATASLDVVVSVFAAVSIDFGDLDEINASLSYHTQLEDQLDGNIFGAGHVLSSLFMGAAVDNESNGQPNGLGNGLGDDQAGSDDEDGVVRPGTSWVPGSTTGGHVEVTVNGDGCLYGWVDWNRNGTFTNTASTIGSTLNDRIIAQSVTAGTITIDFPVPTALVFGAGPLNARFRLYPRDPGGSCWVGSGSFAKFPDRYQTYGGEVEDYTWSFGPTAVNLQDIRTNGPSSPIIVVLLTGIAAVLTGIILIRRRQT